MEMCFGMPNQASYTASTSGCVPTARYFSGGAPGSCLDDPCRSRRQKKIAGIARLNMTYQG